MLSKRSLVLGRGLSPAEDDVHLPREPGFIRRFWARHPLLSDILIVLVTLGMSFQGIAAGAPVTEWPGAWGVTAAIALMVLPCVALLWRRRTPVAVFIVAMLPTLVSVVDYTGDMGSPASVVALYSIAVYRSVRSCWIALGIVGALLAACFLGYSRIDPGAANEYLSFAVFVFGVLLVAAVCGVNAANRRRYLQALVDRSRQLVIERDQQARLAAAAERTRIAREMHDIVAHSLTVVVALAEGARATADPERARDASRAVAATARDALGEMRVMLGVLRSDDADVDAPLGPLMESSLHDIVTAAQSAGFPVTLTVTGHPAEGTAHRLAVLRIVQEGITNAMRHAPGATFIRVTTDYSDRGVRITVENDGVRETSAPTSAGWGLTGLRERVAQLGGRFAAGPAAPTTWRLTAALPLEVPDA